jgi:hypothetical protein
MKGWGGSGKDWTSDNRSSTKKETPSYLAPKTNIQKVIDEQSNRIQITSPWEKVRERMKENDIHLTDEDLEYIPGKEEELIQRLEKIMNRSRAQVVAYIESISSNEDLAG